MFNARAHVALYYQLKEMLTARIKSGEWVVGSRIPTEKELCRMYEVSRITVRKALEEMVWEGYLNRRPGDGTFVTSHKMEQRLSQFYSFSEEIKKMGFQPGTKMIDFSIIHTDSRLAAEMTVSEGSDLYSIKRLRLADNEPFALETSYLPCDIFPDLSPEAVALRGLYNTMQKSYNIVPSGAEEVFGAILVNKDAALELNVKKNSPGIFLERYTYANSRIIEYCRSIIRGDRYKYRVMLK